jgi:GR25 family glycosyltransferase involved in LPS biosynthesis
MATFVINLDRSQERLSEFDTRMKQAGMLYSRWRATDGQKISDIERHANSGPICSVLGCTPGTFGCYVSHISLMNHIIDISRNYTGDPKTLWFLVFEDDAKPVPTFQKELDKIMRQLDDQNEEWTLFRYPHMIQLGRVIDVVSMKATESLSATPYVNGTTCYLLSLEGARIITSNIGDKVRFHIDATISTKLVATGKLDYYIAHGEFIEHHDGLNSTVSNRTFPLIVPLVIDQLYKLTGAKPAIMTMLTSSIFYKFHGKINLNITIISFLALVFAGIITGELWFSVLLLLFEGVCWVRKKQHDK